MRMPGGVVAGVLILLWMAGCNPADRSGLSEPEQPTDPSQVTGVTAVTPSEFTVGSIVEISGYGLPLDLNRVRVSFRGITDQVTGGVRGYPIRVTPNLITVVTPTAVPTGLVTVSVQGEDGGFLQLEPRSVTAGPELTGYLVPTPRRVAGVVEGDQFEIATPQIIVYGRNIDMGVASADVRVLSADRRSVVYSASFSLDTGNRGIPVPGVGDRSEERRGGTECRSRGAPAP